MNRSEKTMTPKKDTAQTILDLTKLSPQQRLKVDRALRPRDMVVSQRFAPEYVAVWRKAAKKDKETLRDWMERVMNKAAAK
jgi:hypothetical protein